MDDMVVLLMLLCLCEGYMASGCFNGVCNGLEEGGNVRVRFVC
jgi:hypothetical protein